ncbi:hypothetical protein LUZ61_003603 [Rhynchospora tenuis]|uniref:Uncharacterized protein n=1 Tax=Rhynchospora tenuis TaxID=198213 RepID=A0AAD6ESS4_9POAL|nr:hypothetical protein LUZ61_003603 [Rhynchospora tenuis]
MAEAIVNHALGKLADIVGKEISFLQGYHRQLDSMQHELRWIRAFLKDAELKRNSDERAKNWVNEVHDVAYRIEDVIDTVVAEVNNFNQPQMISVLNRVLMNPKKLPIVHKISEEINKIEKRIDEISQCVEKYGIRELGDGSIGGVKKPVMETVLPDTDETDVVGLQSDKENIIKLLLDPSTTRRCVVSIVGLGGLGKTTLARKAYNSYEVKKGFDFRVWVSISQNFKLIDLLVAIIKKIRPLKKDEKDLIKDLRKKQDAIPQRKGVEYFTNGLNMALRDKKYLIIMDDIWTEDLWIQVKGALPDFNNGSRVLITTRFSNIAMEADPTYNPYELPLLSDQESQELLLKKAFPNQNPENYLKDLADLVKQFTVKCGNLPLALVILGCLLSRKPPTYSSWNKVFQTLNWHVDGKKCMEVLATSYEDLPAVLKPCFMYLASFPEDYQIHAKSLIRMWVAEGFIREERNKTLEETAEGYLEELLQRSMIQVSKRYYNGSIKYCCIHDLLRDLAIEKAKEYGFLAIISNEAGNSMHATVRRAAQHCVCREIMDYTSPNLRSLLCFGDLPNFSRFKLLNIFSEMGKNKDVRIDNFKELTQLKYLVLCSYIYNDSKGSLWKNVSRMRNLQTLDLSNYSKPSPDCLWDIKTLRHVILPKTHGRGPPPTADLKNLQTLKTVCFRTLWQTKGLPNLPAIRVLRITEGINHGFICWETLATFLSRLHHLVSLQIKCSRNSYEMLDMSSFQGMQSLHVEGSWSLKKAFDVNLFPVHLLKLTLTNSYLIQDPIPILEKLESLKVLKLMQYSYNGKKINCSEKGFTSLENFELHGLPNLEEWKMEGGGMALVKKIEITGCENLQTIPELQHTTNLKELRLNGTSQDLLGKLRGKEQYKIKHVPSIHMI